MTHYVGDPPGSYNDTLILMSVVGVVLIVIWTLVVVAWRRRIRREMQAEVLARADWEHRALCRGDMATGVYGRYQPPRV